MHQGLSIAFAAAVALGATAAAAQAVKAQLKPVTTTDDAAACGKAVKDYLDALRYVRQASGSGIAGRVETAYVPEADLLQIAGQQGPCAAAGLLRSKGLSR